MRAGGAVRLPGDLRRRARGHDPSAVLAAARAHVDHVVGIGDHVEVVLDHQHGAALVDEPLEDAQQHLDVERVQPDRGLVEDEQRPGLGAAQLADQAQALGLAAGRAGVASPRVR